LRRILTGRGRVGLAHLILRNRCTDGGARTGVRRSARMGLVGRDGVPKITVREQGLFPVERSSDRDFLPALVTLGRPRHDRMIAPLSSRSLHADLLVRSPRPDLCHSGLVYSLEPHLSILPTRCGEWMADDFPFASLVCDAVSNPKLHGKDTRGPVWQGWRHTGKLRLRGLGLLLLGAQDRLSTLILAFLRWLFTPTLSDHQRGLSGLR
jgi:hypothetical protein